MNAGSSTATTGSGVRTGSSRSAVRIRCSRRTSCAVRANGGRGGRRSTQRESPLVTRNVGLEWPASIRSTSGTVDRCSASRSRSRTISGAASSCWASSQRSTTSSSADRPRPSSPSSDVATSGSSMLDSLAKPGAGVRCAGPADWRGRQTAGHDIGHRRGAAAIVRSVNWHNLAQYVLSGLSSGCVFALVALGFVLIANVTRVYNFAQGDYVMVGGMIMVATEKAGWPITLGVLASIVTVAGVALVQERLTVAPIRERVGVLGLVVASLGFGVMLRGAALLIWGKDPLSIPSFKPGTFTLLGAHLDNQTLFIWGTTIIALVAVTVLFRWTLVGKAMRACASNTVAARLHGIRAERMSMVAFVVSGALTGLVGAMVVPLAGVSWDSGITVGLIAFIAAAIANFEHPGRAVLAGLGLGVVETIAAGEISSDYREAIVYGVLLVYLVAADLFAEEGLIKRVIVARRSRGAKPKTAQEATAGQKLSGT